MLSGRKVPEYGRIVKIVSDAIDAITQITKQIQFEWLSEASASESNPFERFPCCSLNWAIIDNQAMFLKQRTFNNENEE